LLLAAPCLVALGKARKRANYARPNLIHHLSITFSSCHRIIE
jgi:hypothetical protein